ncbi:hypothetical protein Q9966_002807 [Columba livia]|nr:hypothetical protein Q9966_002807 [Columba livia]
MDPSEDPDDILRANRSQEKTFVFDMVFGHRATQQKPTGVAAGKMTPRLHSPISPDLHGKKSSVAIAAVPLSLETLREIAANTKSISLIAAGRRSRAQCRDPGSKVSSARFSEDDMLELKDLEVSSTPGCQTSIGGCCQSLQLRASCAPQPGEH